MIHSMGQRTLMVGFVACLAILAAVFAVVANTHNSLSTTFAQSGQVVRVAPDTQSLHVAGSDNFIFVPEKGQLRSLQLAGSNNLLIIEPGVSIERFSATGSDNTLEVTDRSLLAQLELTNGNQVVVR